MDTEEIAKEILVALITHGSAYQGYAGDKQEPARVATESYKIIFKGIHSARDEVNKQK
jgi:hypothetical protein